MKNISHLSGLSFFVAALLFAGGCGDGTGEKDLETGRAALEAGDSRKAEKALTRVLSVDAENVDARVLLARAAIARGALAEAESAISEAETLAGGDCDVKLVAAQVAWYRKNYDKARTLFLEIANDKTLSPALRAQGWTGAGIVEMASNEHHLARVDFLRALRLDYRNAAAHYHLGLLYRDGLDQGAPAYPEAALDQFEIFVRLDTVASPRVQKVQNQIIRELKDVIAQNKIQRAGATTRHAAVCASEMRLAEMAVRKGKLPEALTHYRAAMKADPLSAEAALGLAQCWLKTPPQKKGEANPRERAFECFKIACSLAASKTQNFLSAGTLAVQLGYHAQAVEIYSRAVAANSQSLDALDGLIRALRKVGNRTKVAQAYQAYRDELSAPRK